MTSEEILCKISDKKTLIDSYKESIKTHEEEIESLNKQLKKNAKREARAIMRKRRKRAEKLAEFIKHNSSRPLIVKLNYQIVENGVYTQDKIWHHYCKPGELILDKNSSNDWYIENKDSKEGFWTLLECVDNIYVAFE